jgi:hypothetical protein
MNTLNDLLVEMQKPFEIPMENDTTMEFKDFLSKKLDDYYSFIKKQEPQNILESCIEPIRQEKWASFSSIVDFNNCIEKLIKGLKNVLNLYYEGKPAESYQVFKTTLDETKAKNLLNRKYSYFFGIEPILYRARKDESKSFTKTDLFHIGFENRHLIGTTRYSIPGFPALYLGSSTFVCWKEFNEYSFKKLWFSSFKLNKGDYSVLSIDRIQEILDALNQRSNPSEIHFSVIRSLAIFPLMIACSVKTKHHDKPFKPEYIISQLLTQYIADDSNLDGIRYPSTKVDYSKLKGVSAYNYVFPPQKIKSAGHCDYLMDMFYLTEPTNLELEELAFSYSLLIPPNTLRQIEIIKGRMDF